MDLSISNLRRRYLKGELTPTSLIEEIARRMEADPNRRPRWPTSA